MRLAVLSDIHGNLIALETVLADLDRAGAVDAVWMLGDVAAFGPRPAACVQRVRGLRERYGEERTRFIRGNTDRYIARGTRPASKPAEDADALRKMIESWQFRDTALHWGLTQLTFEDYAFLSKLADETSLDAPGYGRVIGYHGTPGDDEGFLRPETPDEEARDLLLDREGRMGIGGHIHVQMDRDLGNWRVLNVGSVGASADRPGYAQYALIDFEGGQVNVDLRNLPYDTEAFRRDLRDAGHPYPDWAAEKVFRLT